MGVEGVGIHQIVVPNLVHDITEEFGASTLSSFVVSKVFALGFVCCFCFDADNSSGIVRVGTVIEWETHRVYERRACMGSGILGRVREESCEGMDPAHSFEWDDHGDGQKHLSDGEEVVISIGGNTSNASLKRRVTVSGRIAD